MSELDYLWGRLNPVADRGECWEALKPNAQGYGVGTISGKLVLLHRWVYTYFVGAIPEGYHVDHICKNRRCCNPDHLEAVTPAENNRRAGSGRAAGDYNLAKTHCKWGHAFDEENTLVGAKGNRRCRTCLRNGARLKLGITPDRWRRA